MILSNLRIKFIEQAFSGLTLERDVLKAASLLLRKAIFCRETEDFKAFNIWKRLKELSYHQDF
jgi:hypothetical protein